MQKIIILATMLLLCSSLAYGQFNERKATELVATYNLEEVFARHGDQISLYMGNVHSNICGTFRLPRGNRGKIEALVALESGLDILELYRLEPGTELNFGSIGLANHIVQPGEIGGLDCILDIKFGGNCNHEDARCDTDECISDYSVSPTETLADGTRRKVITITFCDPERVVTEVLEVNPQQLPGKTITKEVPVEILIEDTRRVDALEDQLAATEDSLRQLREQPSMCEVFRDSFKFSNVHIGLGAEQGWMLMNQTSFQRTNTYQSIFATVGYEYILGSLFTSNECTIESIDISLTAVQLQEEFLDEKCTFINRLGWSWGFDGRVQYVFERMLSPTFTIRHGPSVGYQYMLLENKEQITAVINHPELPSIDAVPTQHNVHASYSVGVRKYITKQLVADLHLTPDYRFLQKQLRLPVQLSVHYLFGGKKSHSSNSHNSKNIDQYEDLL